MRSDCKFRANTHSSIQLQQNKSKCFAVRLRLPNIEEDDDVYCYIREKLKLEGETERRAFVRESGKGTTAVVLMATPCTHSLGGGAGGHKHGGDKGRWLCRRVCINNGSKQKARPKGINLKVH